MRATSDLAKLHRRIQSRLIRIGRVFNSISARPPADLTLVAPYTVIELDNLLVASIRSFLISSLSGARTINGVRISSNMSFNNEEQIGAFILSVLNMVKYNRLGRPNTIQRKEEPTIREPRDIEKIILASGASNILSVQNALALNLAVFRDISTIRNFYAHRNIDTWRKAKNKALLLGIFGAKHADQVVCSYPATGSATLIEHWMFDIELFFEELTK